MTDDERQLLIDVAKLLSRQYDVVIRDALRANITRVQKAAEGRES